MTKTLYDELGVEPTADRETIRKAFRRKAKRAHPDGGGSPEAFERLQRAVMVLSDDKHRAHYDRTADDSAPPPDDTEAKAIQFAFQAVTQVIQQAERSERDPVTFDLLGDAKKKLKEGLAQVEHRVREGNRNSKKLRALAAKFKARKGKTNRFSELFTGSAQQVERDTANCEKDIAVLKRALEVLNDHEFAWEAPDPYRDAPSS